MNKWLAFPLIIMIFILVCVILTGGSLSNANTYNNPQATPTMIGNYTVNGGTGQVSQGHNIVSNNAISLATVSGILALTIGAIVGGIALGIHVLGSGVSTLSQEMTIKLIVYGGIWGCLTAISFNYFNVFVVLGLGIGFILYLILTVSYCIGIVADFRTVGGES